MKICRVEPKNAAEKAVTITIKGEGYTIEDAVMDAVTRLQWMIEMNFEEKDYEEIEKNQEINIDEKDIEE